MARIMVEFIIPDDEYTEEGIANADALGDLFQADLQSLLYDRAGEDGAPPSRDALAGMFQLQAVDFAGSSWRRGEA